MIWQFSLYAVSTLCGGIFALVVAFFAWKRRKIAGGLPLALLMLAVSIWSIANGLENAAVGFAMKLLCGKIAYLGIALAPFMFLLFSLAFLQHQHRISWTMIALFLVIPVTTIGLVFSNEWHHLVWSNITYNSEPGTNILLYQYGPWFWIHAIYVYILIFVSIFLLIRTALRSQQLYRQQSIAILFSTPLPIISNFLYLSGIGPLKGLDLTPIAFSLGGMILTWSIYSLQMFDFLPIAHEKIIENLSDGVIVLDNFNRVVDINANALDIIRKISEQHSFQTPSKVIGEPVENIFAMLPDISNRADEDSRIEMRLGNDKGYQDYELHVSPVSDAKEISLGHILTLYDITKRKHAEEAEHEQRILSDALRNIASALNGTLDLDEVLDRILENIGAVVPHDLATIMLIDEEGIANVVRHRGYREHNLENIIELIHLPVIETPTLHQMMDANVPVLVADTRVDNNWVKIKETEHELSYVGTPIRIVGETVGFINLVSMSPGFFTAHHADRLLAFSDQAAIAIENARLFSKAQKYAQEAEVLHAVGMAINSSLEFEQILDLILEQINTVIPSDTASITLIEKDEVVLKAVRGEMILKQVIGKRWKMRNTPAQQVFETRRPMRFPDVQVSYESYRPEPYSYIKSVLIIPLFVKEDVIGFLYLDSKELGSFTTDDERVASVFATHVAIALENSRLYTETQRRLVEQSILNEIIHSISSKLNLSELIELVYQQINRFIDAQCFMIVSYNTSEENWQVTFEQGVLGTKEGFHTSLHTLDQGLTGYIIHKRQSLLFYSEKEIKAFYQETGVKPLSAIPCSFMGVPLIVADRIIGAMAVQSYHNDNSFSSDDLSLFLAIGSQVAVALENARLFTRMEELATTDPLTGLYNRRHFFVMAENELERALRYEKPLIVMMLDFDHFKSVNDTYGHRVGDQTLQAVAKLCTHELRKMDIIGRYGGDEFAIILPETEKEEGFEVADRLRRSVAETPILCHRGSIHITISIGLANLTKESPSIELLLDLADQALYNAKQAGRNHITALE